MNGKELAKFGADLLLLAMLIIVVIGLFSLVK